MIFEEKNVTKLYGLGSGGYSDYSVYCIFAPGTTEEQAKDLCNWLNGGDDTAYDHFFVEKFQLLDPANVNLGGMLILEAQITEDGRLVGEAEQTHPALLGPAGRWDWYRSFAAAPGRLVVRGFDHERVRKVYGERKAFFMLEDAARVEHGFGEW